MIIITIKPLRLDIMHRISLMMVKETEGVVEALTQTNKYEKQTRLKKVFKNVIEIVRSNTHNIHPSVTPSAALQLKRRLCHH